MPAMRGEGSLDEDKGHSCSLATVNEERKVQEPGLLAIRITTTDVRNQAGAASIGSDNFVNDMQSVGWS